MVPVGEKLEPIGDYYLWAKKDSKAEAIYQLLADVTGQLWVGKCRSGGIESEQDLRRVGVRLLPVPREVHVDVEDLAHCESLVVSHQFAVGKR